MAPSAFLSSNLDQALTCLHHSKLSFAIAASQLKLSTSQPRWGCEATYGPLSKVLNIAGRNGKRRTLSSNMPPSPRQTWLRFTVQFRIFGKTAVLCLHHGSWWLLAMWNYQLCGNSSYEKIDFKNCWYFGIGILNTRSHFLVVYKALNHIPWPSAAEVVATLSRRWFSCFHVTGDNKWVGPCG